MYNFKLTDDEERTLGEWLGTVIAKAAEKSPDPLTKGQPNIGAIGGNLTYSFTPTSLGMIIKVTESITGETIDLTDYDSW